GSGQPGLSGVQRLPLRVPHRKGREPQGRGGLPDRVHEQARSGGASEPDGCRWRRQRAALAAHGRHRDHDGHAPHGSAKPPPAHRRPHRPLPPPSPSPLSRDAAPPCPAPPYVPPSPSRSPQCLLSSPFSPTPPPAAGGRPRPSWPPPTRAMGQHHLAKPDVS